MGEEISATITTEQMLGSATWSRVDLTDPSGIVVIPEVTAIPHQHSFILYGRSGERLFVSGGNASEEDIASIIKEGFIVTTSTVRVDAHGSISTLDTGTYQVWVPDYHTEFGYFQ